MVAKVRPYGVLLCVLLCLSLAGCSLVQPSTPTEIEQTVKSTTTLVVVGTFQIPSVRARFKVADLVVVKNCIDSEILPALDGTKPVSVAAARILLVALDQYLEARGSPPLNAITAEAIAAVAAIIRTKPPGEQLDAGSLAALRGFLSGISAGLEAAIGLYPKIPGGAAYMVPRLPQVRPALRV